MFTDGEMDILHNIHFLMTEMKYRTIKYVECLDSPTDRISVVIHAIDLAPLFRVLSAIPLIDDFWHLEIPAFLCQWLSLI